MQVQRLTFMLAIASAFAGSLSASTIISGTFDLDGSITATLDTITWTSNGNIANEATIENNSDLSGSFVGLGDTNVTIADLNRATEPVGAAFSAQDFVNFLAAPTFPMLMINYIDAGADTSTDCGITTPMVGQTCTPAVPGGSPFGFQNTGPGGPGSTDVTGSTATFSFSGLTSDGLSTWSGVFTAQFNEPYQTVLADLSNPNFSVTNSYSDSNLVITLSSGVPEPGGLTLMGVGLVLLAAGRVRFHRKPSR